MERLNKIFADWSKDDKKTELASEKVELSVLADIKKYTDAYKKYYSELQGLQNRGNRLKKELSETISAIYKWGELGDSMGSDMANMLVDFDKKAKDLGIDAKNSKEYVEGQKSFRKYQEAERLAKNIAEDFSKIR